MSPVWRRILLFMWIGCLNAFGDDFALLIKDYESKNNIEVLKDMATKNAQYLKMGPYESLKNVSTFQTFALNYTIIFNIDKYIEDAQTIAKITEADKYDEQKIKTKFQSTEFRNYLEQASQKKSVIQICNNPIYTYLLNRHIIFLFTYLTNDQNFLSSMEVNEHTCKK